MACLHGRQKRILAERIVWRAFRGYISFVRQRTTARRHPSQLIVDTA